MDNPQITHISHCHGYGGIDLALHRVFGRTFVTVAACEIEAYAVANSLKKIEAGMFGFDFPFWTDIKSFPFGSFYGLVDIYSAGFPCQPFSAAGKGDADDDPRHLWPFIRAGISQMRPEFVFLENVEGIISSKLKGNGWRDPAGTPVLLHVLRELERLGYVPEAGIFSAVEKGASMQRKRTFILAGLANGNRERQSQLRRIIFESRGWVGDGGAPVANPASTGRPAISGGISSYAGPEDRRSPVNDHQLNCGSEGVADPGGIGHRGISHGGEGETDQGADRSPERSSILGHSDISRQERRELRGCQCTDQRVAREGGLPLFPPGPGLGGSGTVDSILKLLRKDPQAAWRLYQAELRNTERWIDILAIRPDLAPALSEAESALCGMADGDSHRVDRLRLCGNGVVPDTAELAFLILAQRLYETRVHL